MHPVKVGLIIFFTVASISCQHFRPEEDPGPVRSAVELRCAPFELRDVRLLEGPFKRAMELNMQSLLHYEPDRLLAKFRSESGLEPKAEHYLGWEAMSLAGHSLGHYMSACAMMFQSTGDERFLERVDYMVGELDACQQSGGNGYVGAFPNGDTILRDEVGKGIIDAAPFYLNGIWAPFYTIHKVMAGLRDAFRLCDNAQALVVEKGIADWLGEMLSELTEEQLQEMLKCEHGGMNEVLADLYSDTGNETYLELSYKFHHKAILDPLSRGEDILPGKHGNTQIPKVIGLATRYELTGEPSDRRTAEFFWERVVYHHSYVNGSHGYHEYFGPADSLNDRLGSETSESCNVYNMLKLSDHLFQWSASPDVADFYELALINHILSSQHPEDGRVLYFHSLQMGGRKEFQDPMDFTCCVGTGMENHSRYGAAIFYKNKGELYLNQFIAAEVHWKEKGVVVRQETRFPEAQGTEVTFQSDRPVRFTLQLRIPSWADERFSVKVNGRALKKSHMPGTYMAIRRRWKSGDRVDVSMPFSLNLLPMPDNPRRIAVVYGPLVLAGDLGPVNDTGGTESLKDPLYVPRIVTGEEDPTGWLLPDPGAPNTFRTREAGRPADVTLRPLYTIHDRDYTVYWDLLEEGEWSLLLKETGDWKMEQAGLERRTLDRVVPRPGMDSTDHNFRSRDPGIYNFNGQPFIESRRGWFSFDMKVDRGNPSGLMVEYWGGFMGPRKFHILVEGDTIATEDFSGLVPNERCEILYKIPAELARGSRVTVKFASAEGHYAGPVFGLRTISLHP